jgi:DNA-binding NarL/FixJ family response regulator
LSDSRQTVVFADDYPPMLQAAYALLQPTYNIIKLASSGEEAVLWIMKLRPDFAVLDICMPDINGFAAAKTLNQAGANTRIVFLGEIEDEDYVREARLLAYGYVLKRRLACDLVPALVSANVGSFFLSQ